VGVSYGVELFTEIDPGERYDWGFETPLYGSFTYTEAHLIGDASSTDTESIFTGISIVEAMAKPPT